MFPRMEPQAQLVMLEAARVADEVGANAIGTEHLLLAVVEECVDAERWGIDAELLREAVERRSDAVLLRQLGISLDEIRETVAENLGADAWGRCRPLDPRTKRALELASRAAGRLPNRKIGWQHLLVGLIRERGVAYRLLVEQGVAVDAIAADAA
jgi:ATP-dependent Clp protease ATP-binding subunit ClpC